MKPQRTPKLGMETLRNGMRTQGYELAPWSVLRSLGEYLRYGGGSIDVRINRVVRLCLGQVKDEPNEEWWK